MTKLLMAFLVVGVPCWASTLQLNALALDPTQFRVTEFATGLNKPVSAVELPDGSIAIGAYNSILRFTDNDNDGIADAAGSSIRNSPGAKLSLVEAGGFYIESKYHFITSTPSSTITVLKPGANPGDPLTAVATLNFTYPAGWFHPNPGLAVRPTPGGAGTYDLVFNTGAQFDQTVSSGRVTLSGLVAGQADGDSLYAITLNLSGATPAGANLRKVAAGIRNVVGMGFQPGTGDFYFADNAIDGNAAEPPQAEELNRILAADFDNGAPPDFGYPNCYIQYRTGAQVGTGCVLPELAVQPIPNGTALGSESEGVALLAFAPANFPAAFRNGVFMGFNGKGFQTGPANEENAVGFYNLDTGQYIHFSENSQVGVYQPIGVYSTANALYISDFGSGKVYQVTAVAPEPATFALLAAVLLVWLMRRRVSLPYARPYARISVVVASRFSGRRRGRTHSAPVRVLSDRW